MNRITTPIAYSYAKNAYILKDAAMLDLIKTGTYVPTVQKLMYNTGTKTIKSHVDENGKKVVDESRKVLTTIVHWTDGTKTVVTNSDHDPIEFEDDGKTPTQTCRERGFIYAFFKRCISQYDVDENGQKILKAEGLGRILSSIIKNAYDCNAKSTAEDTEKYQPDPFKKTEKRPSLAKCAVDLSENIKELKQTIDELKLAKADPAPSAAPDAPQSTR